MLYILCTYSLIPCPQVALNDLNFASYGIRNSEELEDAVTKQRRYPPSISCLTTYHNLMKKFGDPTNAVLEITGADKPMEFVCTAYKYRSSGKCRRQY